MAFLHLSTFGTTWLRWFYRFEGVRCQRRYRLRRLFLIVRGAHSLKLLTTPTNHSIIHYTLLLFCFLPLVLLCHSDFNRLISLCPLQLCSRCLLPKSRPGWLGSHYFRRNSNKKWNSAACHLPFPRADAFDHGRDCRQLTFGIVLSARDRKTFFEKLSNRPSLLKQSMLAIFETKLNAC